MKRALSKTYTAISYKGLPKKMFIYSGKLSERLKELDFIYRSSGLTELDLGFNYVQSSKSHECIVESYFKAGIEKYDKLNMSNFNRKVVIAKRIKRDSTLLVYKRAMAQLLFLKDDKYIYSDFLVCWTPCGSETRQELFDNKGWKYGVSAAAIALGEYYKIPVFNLQNPDALHRLYAFIQENYDFS